MAIFVLTLFIYNKLADNGMNQEKCLITRIKIKC